MYLTAQRVRSLRNKIGVNVFLYLHGDSLVPGMSWDKPSVTRIADEHTGDRAAESVEVAPGGNHVMSYLDIVAADGTSPEVIAATLADFRDTFDPNALPVSREEGGIGVRFGAQFGLADYARDELKEIADRALELLRAPRQAPWRVAEPLAVDVTRSAEGITFALRSDAIVRLRGVHGADWRASTISFTHETREDFENVHGDVYRNVVPLLTGLDLERAAELGGVRYFDATTNEALSVWPTR